jgi:hypothetical protein
VKLLGIVLFLCASATPLHAQERVADGEPRIRRLAADSFPGLPALVRTEMRRLACRVPQGSDLKHAHNVVVGRFASLKQVDWAFLCSANGSNAIHVLWGGPVRCPTPVRKATDESFMQMLGPEIGVGFSRRISPIDYDEIQSYKETFEGPPVPRTWYQGINDYFEGKASTVLLCVKGKWVQVQGMD